MRLCCTSSVFGIICMLKEKKKKRTMLPVGCFLNGIAWWLKSDAACLHLYFHSFLHDSQPLQFMAETPPCFTDGCKHSLLYLSPVPPVPPLPSTSSFVLQVLQIYLNTTLRIMVRYARLSVNSLEIIVLLQKYYFIPVKLSN